MASKGYEEGVVAAQVIPSRDQLQLDLLEAQRKVKAQEEELDEKNKTLSSALAEAAEYKEKQELSKVFWTIDNQWELTNETTNGRNCYWFCVIGSFVFWVFSIYMLDLAYTIEPLVKPPMCQQKIPFNQTLSVNQTLKPLPLLPLSPDSLTTHFLSFIIIVTLSLSCIHAPLVYYIMVVHYYFLGVIFATSLVSGYDNVTSVQEAAEFCNKTSLIQSLDVLYGGSCAFLAWCSLMILFMSCCMYPSYSIGWERIKEKILEEARGEEMEDSQEEKTIFDRDLHRDEMEEKSEIQSLLLNFWPWLSGCLCMKKI